MDSLTVIEQACDLLLHNNKSGAKELIEKNYKHTFTTYKKRSMPLYEKLTIFLRDGFIDRYTGEKLLFPNVLRVLSIELKETFLFHSHWKMADCHNAYWDYFPTCDHIIPIARGGNDTPENIVSTSMKMNSIKSNFLIEEIGLTIHEKGNLHDWDGMVSWYIRYIEKFEKKEDLLGDAYIAQWHRALMKYKNTNERNSV